MSVLYRPHQSSAAAEQSSSAFYCRIYSILHSAAVQSRRLGSPRQCAHDTAPAVFALRRCLTTPATVFVPLSRACSPRFEGVGQLLERDRSRHGGVYARPCQDGARGSGSGRSPPRHPRCRALGRSSHSHHSAAGGHAADAEHSRADSCARPTGTATGAGCQLGWEVEARPCRVDRGDRSVARVAARGCAGESLAEAAPPE